MGGVRRASLLLLVPWLAVCTAQGTICSNEPTVCLGTYTGIDNFRDHLCALPPPCLPHRTLTRREGGSTWGWHAAPTPPMSPPLPRLSAPLPLTPLTPPAGAPLARRDLEGKGLTGSLPTQLGLLTALTKL